METSMVEHCNGRFIPDTVYVIDFLSVVNPPVGCKWRMKIERFIFCWKQASTFLLLFLFRAFLFLTYKNNKCCCNFFHISFLYINKYFFLFFIYLLYVRNKQKKRYAYLAQYVSKLQRLVSQSVRPYVRKVSGGNPNKKYKRRWFRDHSY